MKEYTLKTLGVQISLFLSVTDYSLKRCSALLKNIKNQYISEDISII